MQFELQLPPGASFCLIEAGVLVVSPDETPKLYRYRDDGPLVAEDVVPIEGKEYGPFTFKDQCMFLGR